MSETYELCMVFILKISYKAREYWLLFGQGCLKCAPKNHTCALRAGKWLILQFCSFCVYAVFMPFNCEKSQMKKKMLASLLLTWGPLLQCCSKQTCTPQRLKIATKCIDILLKQRVPVSHRQNLNVFSGWLKRLPEHLRLKIAQTLPWA